MEILICHNKLKRHDAPLGSFGEGAKLYGHSVRHCKTGSFHKYKDEKEPDLIVIFGSGTPDRGKNAYNKHVIIKWCNSNSIPYVMIEEGYIKRGKYWSLSVNGLGRRGEFTHNHITPNRIENVADFDAFEWSGDYIMITKQIPRDANVDVSVYKYHRWLDKMILMAKKLGYEIKVREHPKACSTDQEPIGESLKNVRMVFTYSSNSAVDAILRGIPCYMGCENHVAADLSVRPIKMDKELALPSFDEQYKVLNEIANAQYTLVEMEKGEAWKHIRELPSIRSGR